MKHIAAKWIALFLLLVSVSGSAFAQSNRDYLKGKLRFYFIPHPTTPPAESFLLNNDSLFAGRDIQLGPLGTNSFMGRMAKALLAPEANGGDAALQTYAAEVIKVLNKPVRVFLLNDLNTPLNAFAQSTYGFCPDVNNYAWPCASNESDATGANAGQFAGYMLLGEQNLKNLGLQDAKATFLHELVHTQDQSDSRGHMWTVNGKTYRYGADDIHYFVEATPNLALSYMEGIANTISYLYSSAQRNNAMAWFGGNDFLIVETTLPPASAAVSISPDAWLYRQISSSNPPGPGIQLPTPPYNANINSNYRGYRVRSLAPQFIIHNEQILALIFSEYARKVGLSTYMNALKGSNNQLFRVCASGIAILFNNLCYAGIPDGETLQTVTSSTVPGPRTYLYPLALADYFTGYQANSREQFKAMFEDMLPQEWVEAYWIAAKDDVRTAVPLNPNATMNVPDQINRIATTLGM